MPRPRKLKDSLPGLWRTIRYFWPWIRRRRRLIATSSLALLAATAMRLAEPWPLKFVFDRLIPVPAAGGAAGGGSMDMATLLVLCAVSLVAIVALRALMDYFSKVGFALIGNRVLRDVRIKVYRHVQGLSMSYHDRARGGDLIMRVIRDVGLLRDVAGTAILPLAANVFVLVGMLAVMLWIEWSLALLALTVVPAFWLLTLLVSRRIQRAARKQRMREGEMASVAAESIAAIKVVQALSLEESFAVVFDSGNVNSQKQDMKTMRLSARLERSVDVMLAVGTGLVLWYGASLVMSGRLTPGDLLVFLTYLRRAFRPAKSFAKYTARLSKAAAAGERVIELLEEKPDVRDRPDAVAVERLEGAVCFERVTFGYESERPVLRELDLNLSPGCFVALVGESGIGKSTLFNLLLRLYDPWEGRVLIDGHDLREITLRSLRSQISSVLQDNALFRASVRENIANGAANPTDEEVEAAARLASAEEFIRELPRGWDTVLGERGVTISHGQRQRIAIARAAVRDCPILLLDEPTTGLDPENREKVTAALERLAEGRTTFLATHDMDLAARADLVLHLKDGRLRRE